MTQYFINNFQQLVSVFSFLQSMRNKLIFLSRKTFPDVHDDHLYTIETHVMIEMTINNMDIDLLVGEDDDASTVANASSAPLAAAPSARASYSSSCTGKTLRCVKL